MRRNSVGVPSDCEIHAGCIALLLLSLLPSPLGAGEFDRYWDGARANVLRVRPEAAIVSWQQWTDVTWMATDARNEAGTPGFFVDSVPDVDPRVVKALHVQGRYFLQGYTRMIFTGYQFRWQMFALAETPQVIIHEAQHLFVWATWPLEECPPHEPILSSEWNYRYQWVGHGGPCDLLDQS